MKPILRTLLTIACIVTGGVFLLLSYHQPAPTTITTMSVLFCLSFSAALYLHLSVDE